MIEQKVEAFLERHSISLKGKKIMVGVSGGPDSMALLHYLWRRKDRWFLEITALHVDHMFRGEESFLEAIFVQDFCEKLGIPFAWTQINVTEYMKENQKSSQIAARECRYAFFEKKMKEQEAAYLLLGHHGDDQIETMLMRMTRGSSGKARAGIAVKRPFGTGEIIRPFLVLNKDEIEEYCRLHQLEPRRDPSNAKPYYSRNRYRQEVVPFLKKENPSVHEHFQRMSEELYQDEAFLEELTAEQMNKVMKSRNGSGLTLDISMFLQMPPTLQRRGIQLILNYLYKVRPMSLSALHIDLIMTLLKSPHPSGKLDFPEGLQIIRSYQMCEFLFAIKEESQFLFYLEKPSSVILPDGSTISLQFVDDCPHRNGLDMCLLNPSKVEWPIIIRTRQKGDRIQPKGMRGTKKIKDIFIDSKIPIAKRNSWPIITDGSGSVLWVPQLKVSNDEARHEALDVYLLLIYKKQ